jgi:hypothetical protein
VRTTLSLDKDVAARLQRLRAQGRPFKEIVNDALRAGLDALEERQPSRRRRRYTAPVSLGGSHFPNLDDVWGVIAAAEGDVHR